MERETVSSTNWATLALGAVFYAAGRFAEAVAEFTETVRLKPDLAGARNNLELARRAVGSAGQAKGPR